MAMSESKFYQKLTYLQCLACPDTGASCNVVSEGEARKMSLRWTPSRVTLTSASNTRKRVTGEAEVYCAAENGKVKRIRVIISSDLADRMLLGWQAQINLGLLHPSWPQVWDCVAVQPGEPRGAEEAGQPSRTAGGAEAAARVPGGQTRVPGGQSAVDGI